jgi:hypothetical protein
VTEKLRLLICNDCHSIQELPWYDGPVEHDDTLTYRVAEHRFPNGEEHRGVMATVPAENWGNLAHRQEIVAKISRSAAPGQGAGLGDEFYDVKANFQTDAMDCWKKHNRTTDCGDWRSDAKRLYPDTKAERKAEGMTKTRPNTWLCDFCPVTSIYAQKRNAARGDYD